MVGAWHRHGVTSVNQTRLHSVNQMGKTRSKLLAARHGRGTAWARHGHGLLCVNRPFKSHTEDSQIIHKDVNNSCRVLLQNKNVPFT